MRIFISHASQDRSAAERMKESLEAGGFSDLFLDVDGAAGITPGERWKDRLRIEQGRCAALVALVSAHWLSATWCIAEYRAAELAGLNLFPVLVEPCDGAAVSNIIPDRQICDLTVDPVNSMARLLTALRVAEGEHVPKPPTAAAPAGGVSIRNLTGDNVNVISGSVNRINMTSRSRRR